MDWIMNKEPYKVSICVPIYGVEKYIERCAISLFEQTYNSIEYVFVNDCSPDRSIAILESVIAKYPQKRDSVIILNHERNRGLSAARNTALQRASGEFIYWLDSDDYLERNAIEVLVKVQLKENADIISAHYYEDWGAHRVPKRMPYSKDDKDWKSMVLKRTTMISVWGRLIRLSLYLDNHIKPIEGCNMGEDFQVTPRLFYYAHKLALADDYLYNYNRSNENAYSFQFSGVKVDQIMHGLDEIKCFYKDKEDIYKNSLLIGEANMLAMYTVSCVRGNDRDYYYGLRKRMDQIPTTTIRLLSPSVKLVYFIKPYSLIRLYCNIGHFIKKSR